MGLRRKLRDEAEANKKATCAYSRDIPVIPDLFLWTVFTVNAIASGKNASLAKYLSCLGSRAKWYRCKINCDFAQLPVQRATSLNADFLSLMYHVDIKYASSILNWNNPLCNYISYLTSDKVIMILCSYYLLLLLEEKELKIENITVRYWRLKFKTISWVKLFEHK